MTNPDLTSWRPVADGVWVASAGQAKANLGLVVGPTHALLVDTGSNPEQGAQIRQSIAAVTDVPLAHVVVTHGHYDHAFGLAAFADLDTIGHENIAETLYGAESVAAAAAAGIDTEQLPLPATQVGLLAARDLGGLAVEIGHFGAAHTRGDLVVTVPQRGVVFCGDIVEQGQPPQLDPTSSLKGWPTALEALITVCRDGTVVVPGHGELVTADFVAWQRAGLAALWQQCEYLVAHGVPARQAYDYPELEWPWDRQWAQAAIALAYPEVPPPAAPIPGTGMPLPLRPI